MRRLIFLLSLIFTFFFSSPTFASERIDVFNVEMKINSDASVHIREEIYWNFEDLQKHGIYRDIPYKYQYNGIKYNLRLDNFSVTDEDGRYYNFEVSNNGKYKRIKIGDKDIYVTGVKSYFIEYDVKNIINFEENYDEFYWNATGNEWNYSILDSASTIILPKEVNVDRLDAYCYVGGIGSTDSCEQLTDLNNLSGRFIDKISYKAQNLRTNNGVTVLIKFPKGLVKEPSFNEKLMMFLADNWMFSLPLWTFCIMFYLWWTRGRDPKGREVIVSQFEPVDDLSPAELGTVFDEKTHSYDISAELIELAVKGYIRITKMEHKVLFFKSPDYLFERLKKVDGKLNSFQRTLLVDLFSKSSRVDTFEKFIEILDEKRDTKNNKIIDFAKKALEAKKHLMEHLGNTEVKEKEGIPMVKMSSLRNRFYKTMQEVEKDVYKSVVKKGYFNEDPSNVRAKYATIGIVLLFFIAPMISSIFNASASGFVGIGGSGIVIVIFSFIMPVKTKKGVLAQEHILGFKKYLEVAEKDRLDFLNAPKKNPKTFEKFLPYAMVLEVEEEWARQFEDIYQDKNPSWYSNSNGVAFSAMAFSHDLRNFTTAAHTSLSSRPGSSGGSGGGFSGGGGGGGGGGSW